jgi:hypothetical protein
MARFTVLHTINTIESKKKAVEWLKDRDYDTLFLDFPMEVEGFIKDIVLGAASKHILRQLNELGFIKGREEEYRYKISEPLLELVSQLSGSGVEVYCYIDPLAYSFNHDVANEAAALTLRAKRGKIDVNEWKELLMEQEHLEIKCAEREAKYLSKRAKRRNICLGAHREVKLFLENCGYEVSEVVIDKSLRPLDLLCDMIREEILDGYIVPDDKMEQLIKDHVRFSNLIVEKNYEEAYKIWREGHTHLSW